MLTLILVLAAAVSLAPGPGPTSADRVKVYGSAAPAAPGVTLTPAPSGAAAAPQKTGTAKPVPAARGARQEAVEWFLSAPEDAPAHLVKSGREQVEAFLQNVKDPPELAVFLSAVIAPAATFRKGGAKITTTGQPPTTVTFDSGGSPPLEFTFENEALSGDRALVPLAIRSGTMAARGSIELTREAGAWRIAAADLGPQARWPRFDSPAFVSEIAGMFEDMSRRQQARLRPIVAVNHLRAIGAGEIHFSTLNGGFYGPLECLTAPKTCLPSYAEAGPIMTEIPKVGGYSGQFIAGAAPTAAELRRAGASSRSVKSWAYVLTPTADGPGLPAFCADSTGAICKLPDKTSVTTPMCPATCETVK